MNQISTVLYRINFKYIIDNCLNRELWKKEWTIYDYDNFKVLMRLRSINITDNSLDIKVYSPPRMGSWSTVSIISIPMHKDHFNETVFYQKLFTSMRDVISGVERDTIRNTSIYDTALEMETAREKANEQRAVEYLDNEGVTDEKIREAYIEKYVSDNRVDLTSDVIIRLKYTIHTSRYLMLGHQFEKLCPDKTSALIDDIQSKFADDTVAEYTEKVTKALSRIDFEEMSDLDDALESLEDEG